MSVVNNFSIQTEVISYKKEEGTFVMIFSSSVE